MPTVTYIGVIANTDKPLAPTTLRELAASALRHGVELLADEKTIALAGSTWPWKSCRPHEMGIAKAVIVLGGDGTLLRAAHWLSDIDIPLMGLNIGSLGYLTGLNETQVEDAISAIVDGTISTSDRQMLSVDIISENGSRRTIERAALNEVVLSRDSGRMVHVKMELDDIPVSTYACDGLIVSTPTGSTAYSLSAGGPLVMPGTAATVITVICPHALGSRPIVVSENTRIRLKVTKAETELFIAIDGEEDDQKISCKDTVEIYHSTKKTKIAFLPGYSNYQVLSRKLGWFGSTLSRL